MMKKWLCIATVLATSFAVHLPARAETLAQWTFESSLPTTAGPHAAESGVLAATSFASGYHASSAVVYSNPVGNGSGESFSSSTWSNGDYYQFSFSTLGYQGTTIAWDQARSSTGPDSFSAYASIDGVNFGNALYSYVVGGTSWSSQGDPKPESMFGPIGLGTAFDNQSQVHVRFVAADFTGPLTGTNRIDNVTVSATAVPEPASMLVLGALGVGGAIRRYRQKQQGPIKLVGC